MQKLLKDCFTTFKTMGENILMIDLNNPMNIRISNVPWAHKDNPPRTAQFETFPTAYDGLHAGMENVLHCQTMHGCKTISAIISRLSPPTENNTTQYTAHVCDGCGVQADEDYDLTVVQNLVDISKGIVLEENGKNPYTDELLTEIATDLTKDISHDR